MANMAEKYIRKIGCSLIGITFIVSSVCVQMSYGEREVVRGAAGGALKGAAIGKLSDGDSGKGAAWGAGLGAAKGVANKRRAEQQAAAAEEEAREDARIREMELQQAYERGRRDSSGTGNSQTR